MIYWFLSRTWWFLWRIVVTLACTLTVQNAIHQETNIWIETKPLLVSAVCLIVAIRIWSSKFEFRDHEKPKPDRYVGEV